MRFCSCAYSWAHDSVRASVRVAEANGGCRPSIPWGQCRESFRASPTWNASPCSSRRSATTWSVRECVCVHPASLLVRVRVPCPCHQLFRVPPEPKPLKIKPLNPKGTFLVSLRPSPDISLSLSLSGKSLNLESLTHLLFPCFLRRWPCAVRCWSIYLCSKARSMALSCYSLSTKALAVNRLVTSYREGPPRAIP